MPTPDLNSAADGALQLAQLLSPLQRVGEALKHIGSLEGAIKDNEAALAKAREEREAELKALETVKKQTADAKKAMADATKAHEALLAEKTRAADAEAGALVTRAREAAAATTAKAEADFAAAKAGYDEKLDAQRKQLSTLVDHETDLKNSVEALKKQQDEIEKNIARLKTMAEKVLA